MDFLIKIDNWAAQSSPNEFNSNRKTAPTLHRTKPHHTASKPILIGVGAYNRKTAL